MGLQVQVGSLVQWYTILSWIPPVLLLILFTSFRRSITDIWTGSSPPTSDCLVSLCTPGSHSPWLVCVYVCPLFPIVLVGYCYHVRWSCEHLCCCFGSHATCYCALVLRISCPVYCLEVYTSLCCFGGENKTPYYEFLCLSPIIHYTAWQNKSKCILDVRSFKVALLTALHTIFIQCRK